MDKHFWKYLYFNHNWPSSLCQNQWAQPYNHFQEGPDGRRCHHPALYQSRAATRMIQSTEIAIIEDISHKKDFLTQKMTKWVVFFCHCLQTFKESVKTSKTCRNNLEDTVMVTLIWLLLACSLFYHSCNRDLYVESSKSFCNKYWLLYKQGFFHTSYFT